MHTAEPTTILKRDALGRVTITGEQREALLDEFESSGLKGRPFARMAGVQYPTFANWIQKRGHARGDYTRTALLAAPASPTTQRRPKRLPQPQPPQAHSTFLIKSPPSPAP